MKSTHFRGTFTAIITPFTTEGAIDYEALGRLVENQIDAGIEGLVVLGTTGESPTVSPEEHNQVIKFVIRVANGRTLVIAGTGSNSTDECLHYSQLAAEDGADALLLVSPYYNKPTQAGLEKHFRAIADAVDIPQILYNIAGRTGVNITTDTLLQLAHHPNIVGVKEASGDINQIMDVIDRTPDDFFVLSGDDNITFPLIALGGDGVVSVLSNLIPVDVKALVSAALSGDIEAARAAHFNLLPLMRGCFIETNPIPIKTALALQGRVAESFRMPMCSMQEETKTIWKNLLTAHNVL